MNVPEVAWLRADCLREDSFEIRMAPEVDFRLLRQMKTRGQYLVEREGERVIFVPAGKARDTHCGMLEFRDCFGMPFGWNKKLVKAVVNERGYVLWFPDPIPE